MSIRIVTDSNSGITQELGEKIGVKVIPMPFFIDGEEYLEGVNLNQKEFFNKLANGSNVSTSQPSIGLLMDTWDDILKNDDYIIYIPMSSGLSKSYESAYMLANSDEYKGKVFVVNNKRISIPQEESVYEALEMVNKGLNPDVIAKTLEDEGLNHDIFIMLDTLEYLKKGGRITPAAAALGGFLKLKPVLKIKGDKLDSYKMRNRSLDGAKDIIKDACRKSIIDYLNEDSDSEFRFEVAYSGIDDTEALKLANDIKLEFGVSDVKIKQLSLSISCHTGPNALGMAICKKIKIDEIKNSVFIDERLDTLKEINI